MDRKLVLFSLIGLHIFLLYNLRFTAWPEMISYPYLRNNGYLLYKDMIHPYTPLLTIGLSFLYKIFGYKLEVLKVVTWLTIVINDILIFAIAHKLTKSVKFSIAGLLFYVLTQPFLEGNQLWFDLAIVPFILTGIYFLVNGETKRNLLFAGILIGLATFIKQTSGIFLIVVPIYLLLKKIELKKVFLFLLGPLIIFLTLVVRLISEDALMDFFEWTLINPFVYWSKFSGYVQMAIGKKELLTLGLLITPTLFLLVKLKEKITKENKLPTMMLSLLVSAVLVYPRFSFFHLQLFLALVSIAFACMLSKIKLNPILIVLYFLLIILFISKPILAQDWRKEARFWSKSDLELSERISKATKDSSSVYMLGQSSSLYVFSHKLPPKRWGDNFGWYYASDGVEEEIISRWEKDPARYIVWQDPKEGNSYDLGVYQPPVITGWIRENYTKKEEVVSKIWLWEKK